MYHLNKRSLLFALHFFSIFFPQAASADVFTTTECHCFGVYDKIPDNQGLLSMSYYSSATKKEGYLDIPCPKDGCEPKKGASRLLCGRTAHKEPGGHEGDEAAFPGEVGFCYRNRKGKKDEVLFPVKGEGGTLMERDEDGADIEAQEDQDEEYEEESTPPSSISSSDDTNWQTLSHKTTRRLNSKSVCVEICSRYYGRAIPDCGTYVLPGPGRGKTERMAWSNKCKKTSWRKIPDVPAWEE